MKSKTPLALMELMLMLLIFSVAAALCLQAFLWADRTSRTVVLQDEAVLLAQNTAERVKAGGGDFAGNAESENCRAEITVMDSGVNGLGTARVEVRDSEGNLLYSLPVSWQTELTGGGRS